MVQEMREAAKLCGSVLHHKDVLRKLGSDPCCVRVQLADNLNERGQFFKLWCPEEKIYAESYISIWRFDAGVKLCLSDLCLPFV